MAARLNKRHQAMVREKIRASQLVRVLEDHVLKGKALQPTAVSAALGLLKKCLPDLTATTIQGGGEGSQPILFELVGVRSPNASSTD